MNAYLYTKNQNNQAISSEILLIKEYCNLIGSTTMADRTIVINEPLFIAFLNTYLCVKNHGESIPRLKFIANQKKPVSDWMAELSVSLFQNKDS